MNIPCCANVMQWVLKLALTLLLPRSMIHPLTLTIVISTVLKGLVLSHMMAFIGGQMLMMSVANPRLGHNHDLSLLVVTQVHPTILMFNVTPGFRLHIKLGVVLSI